VISVIRILIILTIVVTVGGLAYNQFGRGGTSSTQPAANEPVAALPNDDLAVLFSAPGVTEPASRAVQIYSEMMGTIGKIGVRSGDRIKTGQLLFELVNDTQEAEVKHCEAQVARASAELAKLKSWDRPEDREVVKAQWEEAKALLERAEFEIRRIEALNDSSSASAKEINDIRNEGMVQRARTAAAKAKYDRSVAGPRPEEIAVAQAQVSEAESQLAVARTTFEKTRIRSPLDGMVIYRFREPGESVFPNVPAPILSIGNRDVLRVRADVDELDFGKVRLGQRAFTTCDAFGSRRFYGTIVEIAQTLGRKNFRTDRPTEKADTKILEVVLALDDGRDLPIELQMAVWFLRDTATTAPASAPGGVEASGGSSVGERRTEP
jgi:HlyD family secretion protein